MNTQIDSNSETLNLLKSAAVLKPVFSQLTKNSGGTLIFSSDLATSLATISEIEDVYYMLSYAPENANKKGKINVKVSNKNYDVLYDNNKRADYIATYLNKKAMENPSVKDQQIVNS